ncbi:MAG TPA: hypothetical protein VES19_00825 [Candidatus Limnocylindrales bacterium]|nr:hypothetical protein [Candidatus Limnocylindrales bacterium]
MLRSLPARLALIVVAATALGACSLLPPEAVPEALNPVIVTYAAEGGECPQAPCGFQAEIRRDGTVKRSDGVAQTVDEPSLRRLIEQVGAADWKAILAKPFTGECPRNVDGQESIYTFNTAAGGVTVAGCTVEIDPGQEPFQSVQGILFGVGG